MRFTGFAAALRAVDNVRGEIQKALVGHDADDQKGVDAIMEALDGTENLSRLGVGSRFPLMPTVHIAAQFAREEAANARRPPLQGR